ncbi:hypothetical protein FKM82_017549 [Ascaphus truei]
MEQCVLTGVCILALGVRTASCGAARGDRGLCHGPGMELSRGCLLDRGGQVPSGRDFRGMIQVPHLPLGPLRGIQDMLRQTQSWIEAPSLKSKSSQETTSPSQYFVLLNCWGDIQGLGLFHELFLGSSAALTRTVIKLHLGVFHPMPFPCILYLSSVVESLLCPHTINLKRIIRPVPG